VLANISVDLDNLWAYQRAAKIDGWEENPSYLPLVIPRIIKHLAVADLTATIFVVARDLESQTNFDAIRQFSHAGHELANHSYEHEPWLQTFDETRLTREITLAGEKIAEVSGISPIGFRGPGFSDSPLVHRMLAEQGYRYVASSFPSCIGPVARAFYLAKTGLKGGSRDPKRSAMFGNFRDVFQRNRPHRIHTDKRLWMFPVTVQPMTRLPFHFTYLFYLSQFSPAIARMYFRVSLGLCNLFRVSPSMLLHPTDFLSHHEEPSLAFFPGMKMRLPEKLRQLQWFLDYVSARFEVVSMNTHWQTLSGEPLPIKLPSRQRPQHET
jgi:hypothetical protein